VGGIDIQRYRSGGCRITLRNGWGKRGRKKGRRTVTPVKIVREENASVGEANVAPSKKTQGGEREEKRETVMTFQIHGCQILGSGAKWGVSRRTSEMTAVQTRGNNVGCDHCMEGVGTEKQDSERARRNFIFSTSFGCSLERGQEHFRRKLLKAGLSLG